MPFIKYAGPFDAVEVDGLGVVQSGEIVEAGPDLANSLLEQGTNWVSGKKPAASEIKES
jgi:hypothetical protein